MFDPSKYLDWIKLSPRYLLPLVLFTGFVLFAPVWMLDTFGLTEWIDSYRPIFGLVFLLSSALFVSGLAVGGLDWIKGRRRERQVSKARRQSLHRLSEPEKEILRGYIDNSTTTRYLSMGDGVVGGLEAQRIDSWVASKAPPPPPFPLPSPPPPPFPLPSPPSPGPGRSSANSAQKKNVGMNDWVAAKPAGQDSGGVPTRMVSGSPQTFLNSASKPKKVPIAAAADATGVNRATIHRWLEEPEFQAAYASAKHEIFGHAVTRLQKLSTTAVDQLEALLDADYETVGPGVKLGVARTILDVAASASIDELAAEVEELKRHLLPPSHAGGALPRS